MKHLFTEDPNKKSERNKLKVTTFRVEIDRDKNDLGVAHINIPSRLYKKNEKTRQIKTHAKDLVA